MNPLPLQFLMLIFAGWVNRHQQVLSQPVGSLYSSGRTWARFPVDESQ